MYLIQDDQLGEKQRLMRWNTGEQALGCLFTRTEWWSAGHVTRVFSEW